MPVKRFDGWTASERRFLRNLSSPFEIQAFLDSVPYNVRPLTLSPREVMRQRQAHCYDGALFAAAALEFHGEPPLLIDLLADQDDHHVLAIYRRYGLYGSIAKSNFTGTRFRDPVYRTLRELAMSYFNMYFNLKSVRSLRQYSSTLDLRRVQDQSWRTSSEDVTMIDPYLDRTRHYDLVPAKTLKILTKADKRLFQGETLGIDKRGAFKV